eukprot:CAMPEP_0172746480 /NCGR_PEP_ID=MMETSP1074-20121228/140698_1 /TAXON_ID=2916 /ORGANISM="Ceratium fusus, Strain PA161109" /LENGTH=75 /DNA_ID=CAMNT_0013577855 /DNA_START=478 /DNA_END=702 /DNA_ORIENTATION=-
MCRPPLSLLASRISCQERPKVPLAEVGDEGVALGARSNLRRNLLAGDGLRPWSLCTGRPGLNSWPGRGMLGNASD